MQRPASDALYSASALQSLIYPPEVPNVAPVDGVRVMAEVVLGQLPQGLDLVEDQRQGLEIGLDGSGLGVHRGAPWLVDDATIHALNDQEAKKEMMPKASNPRLMTLNLINCNLCDSNRLYAAPTVAAGALP